MNAARTTAVDGPRTVLATHQALLAGADPTDHVRSLVVESWFRSAAAGLDCERALAPITLQDVAEYRTAHPLSPVFPLLYDVLGQAAEACDSVMAIGDAEGQLLWVCGTPRLLARAEQINFVEGALWTEAGAGTNAPGTALRLDSPVQIRGAEHFTRAVQRWSCVAAPIHDPLTQGIIGVVDVTGGPEVSSPQAMAMVRAASRMAEAELGRLYVVERSRRASSPAADAGRRLRIDGLGRPDCHVDDGVRSVRLSPRHSEILAILSEHPTGLTADQLAIDLYGDHGSLSTVRAEMTRIRTLLGDSVIGSRPYRLCVPPECDWLTVHAHLAAGRLADAVRNYRGPLLPQSDAPGVIAMRDNVANALHAAVYASGSADLMLAWTRSKWGADDLRMWERLRDTLPSSSPLRPIAAAEAGRLNADLGCGDGQPNERRLSRSGLLRSRPARPPG